MKNNKSNINNNLKWNKSILFPYRLRDLWPQIKSQAALDDQDIGEWVTEALELKLSSNKPEDN